MLKIITVEASVGELVKANNGYCPCAVIKNEDTPGLCHCGRYEKVYK